MSVINKFMNYFGLQEEEEITERYIELYEKIMGEAFVKADVSHIENRIEENVNAFLASYTK